MKKFKTYSRIAAMAVAGLAGSALVSCDDEKLLTTDYEETFIVKEITMDVTADLPLPVAMDTTISFTVTGPENCDKSVIFMSSNEAVATVDQNGTITGVSEGTAVITCTLPVGFGPSATVNVNVIPELIQAKQINLENTTALGEDGKIYETDEIQLQAEILPANHTYSRLVWKSSDESVATVDNTGLVKCLKKGTAIITAVATDRSGVKGMWQVTIDEYIAIEKIEITQPSEPIQILGGPVELDVTYYPASGTKGSVTWESSDEAVATVHRGVVTPVGFGSASITGTCDQTGQKVTVDINIPDGWYVWDASNKFLGFNKCTSWISNNENPTIENGVWRVHFPDAGTGKWRRDIKLNCSNNDMLPIHSSRPVLAMRCTIPRGGNNTWDVRDSGNPKCNDGVDLPDGTRLIYIDLSAKFTGWGAGYHSFNLFQLKVADIPNANVDKSAAYYDVYWARTFTSLDEAKAFAIKDATDNPRK